MSIQQTFDFLGSAEAVERDLGEVGCAPSRQVAMDKRDSPRLGGFARDSFSDSAIPVDPRAETLRQLRARIERTGRSATDSTKTFSTGCRVIDDWLPRGGLRGDAITEWVQDGEGCGAATLSLIAAANGFLRVSSPGGGPLVVVSGPASGRRAGFYPPAAAALGIPMQRLIWVQPKRHADLVWAIDQSLRCQSVSAVWAEIGSGLDDRDARRFQLAAETGQTAGLFIRPASVRGVPSFADTRFHVVTEVPASIDGGSDRSGMEGVERDGNRLMRVTLDRCRGGTTGHQVWVRVDDLARVHSFKLPSSKLPSTELPSTELPSTGAARHETTVLPLASQLAHPKSASRAADRRRA